MKIPHLILIAVAAVLCTSMPLIAAEKKAKKTTLKPFPLSTCIVSDEKLGGDMGDPVVFTFEGREMKLCCKSCEKDFKKDRAKFVKKFDEAAKKVKAYPLQACLVTDEKLGGDMGEPYVFVHEGREVRLCCESCLKDFKKDLANFLKKWDTAAAAATKK